MKPASAITLKASSWPVATLASDASSIASCEEKVCDILKTI